MDFCTLEFQFDVKKLQLEVNEILKCDWVAHVNQRAYQGQWDVFPLRCAVAHQESHPILQAYSIENNSKWVNLPALSNSPYLSKVINLLKCPIQSVRLMRLKAGASILPHNDAGLGLAHGQARLHVPIFSNNSVTFYVANQLVPMPAGKITYINADQVHEVRNQSAEDRIHLVIDCVSNAWLEENIRELAHV